MTTFALTLVQASHGLRKVADDNPNGVAVDVLHRIKDKDDWRFGG
jgi:hypothetical protein